MAAHDDFSTTDINGHGYRKQHAQGSTSFSRVEIDDVYNARHDCAMMYMYPTLLALHQSCTRESRTTTVACARTVTFFRAPTMVPLSVCAHKSRTVAFALDGHPRAAKLVPMAFGASSSLYSATAMESSERVRAQTVESPGTVGKPCGVTC